MEYMNAAEAAVLWGVSPRQAQRLLSGGRVAGAVRYGRQWMIPRGAAKPSDLRAQAPRPDQEKAYLPCVMLTSIHSLSDPKGALSALPDDSARAQYEAELAYLRGDFSSAKRCLERIGPDDASYLCACTTAMSAAISTGDGALCDRAEAALKAVAEGKGRNALLAQMSLSLMAASMFAPRLCSAWVREGDFDSLPAQARPMAVYLYAKYLQATRRYSELLEVCRTALTLCARPDGFTALDIYLRLLCAGACQALKKPEEARRNLDSALSLAMPRGLITPFVEMVTATDGLLETCLARDYPDCYDAVIGRWENSWKNWLGVHNKYTRDNITLILSLREYQVAQLLSYGSTYAEAARKLHLSVSRVNEIVSAIYDKLSIQKKAELELFIL